MQCITSRSRQALTLCSALALTTALVPARAVAQDDDDRMVTRGFSIAINPARIGVMVQLQPDKDNDKIGATISDVTEDSPADKAGLKGGDIITKFNGTSLAGIKSEDDDVSGPGRRLVRLAQKLEDGDTVQVEYRRGNDSRKATLVAKEFKGSLSLRGPMTYWRDGQPRAFNFSPGNGFGMIAPDMGRVFSLSPGRNSYGLELTDLSPELGEYFGARAGVLVLKTPKDSSLGLKAGDVITAIDGRTPTSESQVYRILSSYDAGEPAKIEVLRKQKKVTVSYKVPEQESRWKTGGDIKVRRQAKVRT
ncbi:MAG TPA: PDZ domain-containing protein [Gemmatimonadales bacterium]|nr:PDZ domain-containing protein [Gemmatimonadales bacterium]